jgi:hypothetical protein
MSRNKNFWGWYFAILSILTIVAIMILSANFKSIRSIDDLYRLEQQPHWQCDATARKKWVFFHAACLHWNISDKLILSRKKSSVQRAILTWVRETQPQQE